MEQQREQADTKDKNAKKKAEPRRPLPEARLLNVVETAHLLNLSPKTVYNRLNRKAAHPFPIPAKRIGKTVRFDRKDVDAYIDSL